MSSKTKIVVLRMKEIIYTAIFVGLGIFLITLFLIMFRSGKQASPASADGMVYQPGIYTTALTLGSQQVDVAVTVNANRISSISLIPLSDSVETMFPLVQPTLNDLSQQIIATQSLENISYSSESKYTSIALLNAIESSLKKAQQ